MTDRPDWKPKIEIAARTAFARALREIGAENLCGFALYTDESAMSLSATVNTEAHFKAVRLVMLQRASIIGGIRPNGTKRDSVRILSPKSTRCFYPILKIS